MDAKDENIEFFKKIRDISSDIVDSYEKEDEKEFESAIGRFMLLMMTTDSMKK
ncbi:hypothetical protein [Oceanobacillus arenosus]|uniref:hypothetical protein n=1 Tax=Oceanobacillus arenosus TaxID=1229153 RepID=UPI001472D5B3|nr:hypothetical protein [Oceanobacillus arenosus]